MLQRPPDRKTAAPGHAGSAFRWRVPRALTVENSSCEQAPDPREASTPSREPIREISGSKARDSCAGAERDSRKERWRGASGPDRAQVARDEPDWAKLSQDLRITMN